MSRTARRWGEHHSGVLGILLVVVFLGGMTTHQWLVLHTPGFDGSAWGGIEILLGFFATRSSARCSSGSGRGTPSAGC